MSDSVQTEKGTILPLMNLKGKPYMMVAHRIVWFNEAVKNYMVSTEFLKLTDDESVVKATVTVFDDNGKVVKQAVGTKSENRKSFGDFIEKSETGAIGRAITTLGFGTAYALADLEEGSRIIDSPVVDTRALQQAAVTAQANAAYKAATAATSTPGGGAGLSAKETPVATASIDSSTPKRVSTFRKKGAPATVTNGLMNGTGGVTSEPTATDSEWT